MIVRSLKNYARAAFAMMDIHLERRSRHPAQTLLGLSRVPIRHVIDVGANRGQFAAQALDLFPDAVIDSFEPLPGAFAELSAVAMHSRGRLRAHNFALGAEKGVVQMFYHSDHSASSSLLPATDACLEIFPQTRAQEQIKVNVRRLDEILSFDAKTVGGLLVKLDAQGSEASVIAGGRRTIEAADAVIVEICLEKLYVDAPSFEDICNLLSSVGHRFAGTIEQIIGDDGSAVFIDALFKKKQG